MATSGTVGSTIFLNQQIIDHAFRRCKMVEQEITGEHLQIALELMWLFCMTLVNKGIKLWNIQPVILPMYEREETVPLPLGTENILDINLRTLNRVTGTATATEGVADNAFDGDVNTSCTQTSAAGNINMEIDSGGTAAGRSGRRAGEGWWRSAWLRGRPRPAVRGADDPARGRSLPCRPGCIPRIQCSV